MANGKRDQRGGDRRLPRMEGAADGQDMPGWSGRIMAWLRVAAQLVAIQLLMVAGTVLGLVVAGLGPALVAGGSLLARIVAGDATDALWRDFWSLYRAQFRRAAIVTAPLVAILGLSWYELLVLLSHGTDTVAAVMAGALIAVGLYVLAGLAYVPAVLRRYADPAGRSLRFVALAPLLSPLTALACMVTMSAAIVIGLRFLPAFLVAGLSVPVLLTGLLVDRWLDKLDARADSEAGRG
ncbi:DUF624 domain-containing protein [Demequina sp.]|uniref:YesL family protein n=1 Tax=Demequina sp. TaxID=2050685 RepID=UPI0025CFF2F9|nr:DUF624 domain-containing protein [Demequina sp.]